MKKVKRLWLMAIAVLMSTAATAQESESVETTIAAATCPYSLPWAWPTKD